MRSPSYVLCIVALTCNLLTAHEIKKIYLRPEINTTKSDIALYFTADVDTNGLGSPLIIDSIITGPMSLHETATNRILASGTQIQVITAKRNIKLKIPITKETKPLIEILMNEQAVYFDTRENITIITKTQDTLTLSPESLRIATSTLPPLSDKQRNELVDAYGGYQALLGRGIEAGWQTGNTDSLDITKYVSFSFVSELIPGSLAEFSGLLSTKINDAASRIRFTPMIYRISNDFPAYGKATYEISQSGNDQRIYASIFYQGIVGNFIDLSGGYNRLRLFPIVTSGLDGMYYIEANDTTMRKKVLYEPFIQLYYYIPVYERFNIVFNGGCKWRSDADGNLLKNNVRLYGELSLGYEPPQAGIVILAKYVFGTHKLSYQKDDKIVIEALLDFFKKK